MADIIGKEAAASGSKRVNPFDFSTQPDIAWCPGCGDFPIRNALLAALDELEIERKNLVMVSGIGQAAKMPQYVNSSFFNGLHGRGLPAAQGIKSSNPNLTVIAEGGDGDMYGEGGNHFLHATRRNSDITLFVHSNLIYGLTKGQAAPTSHIGLTTPIQVGGVFEKPLNPVSLAIALDVCFVARAFSGDIDKLKAIMKLAIQHKGFALVDIFQPCVTFNKLNTFQWFRQNTYYLPSDYDPADRMAAFGKAQEESPWPLGVLYQSKHRTSFEDNQAIYRRSDSPLWQRHHNSEKLAELIRSKR